VILQLVFVDFRPINRFGSQIGAGRCRQTGGVTIPEKVGSRYDLAAANRFFAQEILKKPEQPMPS